LRIDGGAAAVLKAGSQMNWGAVSSQVIAISNAGNLVISGTRINKAGTAIANAGRITATGLEISGSTTGLYLAAGGSGIVASSTVDSNATDIAHAGGTVTVTNVQASRVVGTTG
jgi:hypothetical protein